MARITAPVLSIGVRSDTLYPPYQQHAVCDAVVAVGGRARYVEIDSPHGHDAFLIDLDQVGSAVSGFLESVEKSER
jgi:homoserine O-acetyltransferase